MRVLAKELRISVITTQRAYEELEHDGFIETVTGKGSFVARQNTEFLREDEPRRVERPLKWKKTGAPRPFFRVKQWHDEEITQVAGKVPKTVISGSDKCNR